VLGGIRLRIRRVGIDVTREGFMFNPTSCRPAQVRGTISSAAGDTAPVSSPFGVSGCSGLPFGPALAARLAGKGQTKANRSPAFSTTITQPAGDAHLRFAAVTLPQQVGVQLDSVSAACAAAQLAAGTCPAASKLGDARAETPVLAAPLTGPIYLVASDGSLPHMVVQLRGQIALDLVGAVEVDDHGRLVTKFAQIPDVPISTFSLTLHGGTGGVLRNNVNLCRSRAPRVRATFVSHSQKRVDQRVKVPVDGCSAKKAKHRRRHAHRRTHPAMATK
jgi:hypothetical protein